LEDPGADRKIILRWIFRKVDVEERPRRRWEDNIKMDLQEVVCGGMD